MYKRVTSNILTKFVWKILSTCNVCPITYAHALRVIFVVAASLVPVCSHPASILLRHPINECAHDFKYMYIIISYGHMVHDTQNYLRNTSDMHTGFLYTCYGNITGYEPTRVLFCSVLKYSKNLFPHCTEISLLVCANISIISFFTITLIQNSLPRKQNSWGQPWA